MKWWYALALLMAVGCYQRSSDKKAKVKATHVSQGNYTASAAKDSLTKDSIIIEEQNRHGEWMVKTFYALKQMGFNYKKTWNYIDSTTESIYNDSIPAWYQKLKQQTDSAIRNRQLYKRKPIV